VKYLVVSVLLRILQTVLETRAIYGVTSDIGFAPVQVNCSISGNIVIRVLQYRAAGGGYIQ